MSANSRVLLRPLLAAAASAAGIFVAGSAMAAEDVKFFDKAPTADELRKSLMESTPQAKPRTRGIVFGAPAEPAPAPAPAPAAVPAASAPSPAPPAQPAAQATAVYAPSPAAAPAAVAVPTAVAPAPAALAPAAPAPAQGRTEIQVSEKAIAFPINFKLGRAQIEAESVAFIDIIADFMKQNPNVRLLVEGHTDATGNAERNLALSRERAFSVSSYLIDKHRIEPTRLLAVGRGQTEPMQALDPKNARNRRVQFRMIGG